MFVCVCVCYDSMGGGLSGRLDDLVAPDVR